MYLPVWRLLRNFGLLNFKAMKKTIFITGASSGIGRATAELFFAKGWNVVATMRSPDKERGFVESERLSILTLDVENPESIRAAVGAAVKRFGAIDVLVNNAGFAVIGVFESSRRDQVRKQFAVNVFGLIDVTCAVLPHLRANGGGVIINLSSYGGLAALPMGSLYNSTKFAVEGLSEALALELAGVKIAVKLIEPGAIATNFRNNIDRIDSHIPDYERLESNFWGRHASLTEPLKKAGVEEVAETIYGAATDGEKRLRYVVGEDAQFFIDRKFNTPESEYLTRMQDYFHS
jgi:NAD(P)-dependent dehydrogenase (short-subunit alcohol dehydrogenase family)